MTVEGVSMRSRHDEAASGAAATFLVFALLAAVVVPLVYVLTRAIPAVISLYQAHPDDGLLRASAALALGGVSLGVLITLVTPWQRLGIGLAALAALIWLVVLGRAVLLDRLDQTADPCQLFDDWR
jgi:hypothetical protein